MILLLLSLSVPSLTIDFRRGSGVEQDGDNGAKQLHKIHLLHVHHECARTTTLQIM